MVAQTEEATPVSTWQALVGIPITDEFLEWPADLFALTEAILPLRGVSVYPIPAPRC